MGIADSLSDLARYWSLSDTNTLYSNGKSPVISANISAKRSFCLHRSTSSVLQYQRNMNATECYFLQLIADWVRTWLYAESKAHKKLSLRKIVPKCSKSPKGTKPRIYPGTITLRPHLRGSVQVLVCSSWGPLPRYCYMWSSSFWHSLQSCLHGATGTGRDGTLVWCLTNQNAGDLKIGLHGNNFQW